MTEKERIIKFGKFYSEITKKCRFSECLYPDSKNCSDKVIKSHSIQLALLKKMSVKGMVISFDIRKTLYTNEFGEIGIKSASTFTGFCNYHDTVIFSEIENKYYEESEYQNFLYAFRACIREYVKKKESVCHINNLLQKFKSSSYSTNLEIIKKASITGQNDLSSFLDLFFQEISKEKSQNFNIIKTFTFKLSYEALIVVNSVFTISNDFQGKRINNLTDTSTIPTPVFLNVFPQNKKTVILLSWFEYSDEIYNAIKKDIEELSDYEKELFFTNLILCHCENFFMSPQKYNRIGKKAKQFLVDKFIKTTGSQGNPNYLTEKPSVNLFRVLKRS